MKDQPTSSVDSLTIENALKIWDYRDDNGIASEAAFRCEERISRKRNFELFHKYIEVKHEILQEVDSYREEMGGYCIGVHYRGSDKAREASKVAYEKVLSTVDDFLKEKTLPSNWRIFVASDEADFIKQAEARYPGRVVVQHDIFRSVDGEPIHMNRDLDGYEKGKGALIDSLLLSRCSILFRCSSNLSLVSTFFNPDMEVRDLSSRYDIASRVLWWVFR